MAATFFSLERSKALPPDRDIDLSPTVDCLKTGSAHFDLSLLQSSPDPFWLGVPTGKSFALGDVAPRGYRPGRYWDLSPNLITSLSSQGTGDGEKRTPSSMIIDLSPTREKTGSDSDDDERCRFPSRLLTRANSTSHCPREPRVPFDGI